MKLILGDPAFVGERETPSFKFIRAARFLKDSAPHVFAIRDDYYYQHQRYYYREHAYRYYTYRHNQRYYRSHHLPYKLGM